MAKIKSQDEKGNGKENKNRKENSKKGKDKDKKDNASEKAALVDLLYYSNLDDLRKNIKNPKTAIVVSHVPPKFSTPEAVDYADYGVATKSFEYWGVKYKNGKVGYFLILPENSEEEIKKKIGMSDVKELQRIYAVPQDSVFSSKAVPELRKIGAPVEVRKGNIGSEELRKIYKELGIVKSVSGHVHESAGKANDSSGKSLPEESYSKELFYNSGALENGQAGIVSVRGEEMAYRNLKV
jgi:Icc-related predicted phosphoesterase